MILTEITTIQSASLPLELLKQHLRLGTGFVSGTEQDELLEAYLRAAISAIEGRTGCVLINKVFSWGLTGWRHYDRQVLPVRPVNSISELKMVDHVGGETIISSESYYLEKDSQNPALISIGLALPVIPQHGSVEVTLEAGFGTEWNDVPDDLGRAVLLLAADFYENRTSHDAASLPSGILALLERFRKVRLLGGV